ncbi:MAG TPA: ATP-dependent DNA helicase RecG [Candidatus Gallacutalibacter stercoravium]|nr:ATP-dependent DNA helicase RecG [Candidatus Gallacutalibacter stercoravium]
MASLFEKDISLLKGVGPKRAQLFHKLGVATAGALLHFYPRAYEDWSSPLPIAQAPFDNPCCIRAFVASQVSESRIRKGLSLYKVTVSDSASLLHITFFNNPYAAKRLKEGEEYYFYGKVGGTFTRREMTSPLFEPVETGPRIRPIYSQTEGLSTRQIESAVRQVIQSLPDPLPDSIPQPIIAKYRLCSLRFALEKIHFPTNHTELEAARRRLIFEELLVLQLGFFLLKGKRRKENAMRLSRDDSSAFFARLPFSPTNAQRRAVAECLQDMMHGSSPMNRLIQGDVGSGKTAVAAALCYCVACCGMQSALMAPTEILAEQHYHTMQNFMQGSGVNVALLTGSSSAAEKREIRQQLQDGNISLVVGTHALLTDDVAFRRLALVVTDEQHRFGVGQRAKLAQKGNNPHLLVMSATPIPRTLALMIYGDLDVSVLDELPPGRQPIDTFWVGSNLRQRVYAFIKKHLAAGQQAYIVCPLVEENDSDLASAQEYADRLQQEDFRGYSVGLLHGKMKAAEKEQTMRDFSCGKIQLLVSTTVIEVGVDVPNAVLMVVENAERFGLSQLHQLRGRVGRGKQKSYCILLSDAQNEEAKRRLNAMCRTNDGFQIAEEDLRLRGPGDFFGARQHGLPDLKLANLVTDMRALNCAQQTASQLLAQDPDLSLAAHRGLRVQVKRLFAQVGEGGMN